MKSFKRTIVPKIVAGRRLWELWWLGRIFVTAVGVPLAVVAMLQVRACRKINPTWPALRCLAPHAAWAK